MSLLDWLTGPKHEDRAEIARAYGKVERTSANYENGVVLFDEEILDREELALRGKNLLDAIKEYEQKVPARTRRLIEGTAPTFRKTEERVKKYLETSSP
ncbi:MAG: hypothetical protein KC506_02230 [Nanoarchaeota archaeon]|nr:hypothetical protein [Nanoarchaeota archaeon]